MKRHEHEGTSFKSKEKEMGEVVRSPGGALDPLSPACRQRDSIPRYKPPLYLLRTCKWRQPTHVSSWRHRLFTRTGRTSRERAHPPVPRVDPPTHACARDMSEGEPRSAKDGGATIPGMRRVSAMQRRCTSSLLDKPWPWSADLPPQSPA
jgi:hypothetical protein